MNPIQKLHSLGQSIWYDNIQRRLLDNGELEGMISRGEIRGVTSNPSIFNNAIAKTSDYDPALVPMAWSGWDAETIFWQLAVEDIRRACDLFKPLYIQTKGGDGYISLEVHPALAVDTKATVAQAKYLWDRVARANLMIKIPATKEGMPAIKSVIASGINVNVTLIFSIERYREVMEAYLSGLEERLRNGKEISTISSVASFFISRMDTKVDALLPEGSSMRGKAAIANAKLAYAAFRETFRGPRWEELARAKGSFQRPLWASTSTKNQAYPDTIYVDSLIGRYTVNTVPPQTLDAFIDHGQAAVTIKYGVEEARQLFAKLEETGISIARVTNELEEEGVKTFTDAFTAMLQTIEERRATAASELEPLTKFIPRCISKLEAESFRARLWAGDPTLWTGDIQGQEEIRTHLGWLRLPETSRSRIHGIKSFADEVHHSGIRKFLLLGMGGSSLAPEVLSKVFTENDPSYKFAILDSTDPAQVSQAALDFPPVETLYLVSSKSGGTAEVSAMMDYFWELSGNDGSRFVAITDPGTSLDALANVRGFRKTFLADPSVGGRFSVLADFGLVPMALMGLDLEKVLASANSMMHECGMDISCARNPGIVLGAVIGEAAIHGRDKLTLIADPPVAAVGSWLEQLIEESSGKEGKGIIVVDGEPVGDPSVYGEDRLFVYLKTTGENTKSCITLRDAGHPVLELTIPNIYSLIAEFYRWEIATATACSLLGVNAFNQPDVQDNKTRTKNKITAYSHDNMLTEPSPHWKAENIQAWSNQELKGAGLPDLLAFFLASAKQGNYVAINAYLPRTEKIQVVLNKLRLKIRSLTNCATTVGFGPRFLHSTGQLHKGGPGTGIFLQITSEPTMDLVIPGQGMTFGILEHAQALGDYEALSARGRKILRIHLPSQDSLILLVDAVN
jgi:transaldolase / glucose-6-phosphate isomerase